MSVDRCKVSLSVIVPVYGCGECLTELHKRLKAVLAKAAPSHEIVFVDDRSPDGSWETLQRLALEDPDVQAIRLTRNFGQHAAITAGLGYCTGEQAIVLDCDLQDPPEEIPRLLEKAGEGFDIVFARRMEQKHPLLRRLASRAFFRLLSVFNDTRIDGSYGSFSLIARPVINAFLRFEDRDRHYLLIIRWLGFRVGSIDYLHGERYSGRSAYSMRALLAHAFDGLLFQTTALLRLIVYLGFAVATTGALLMVYFVYLYFARSLMPGWTSLSVLILIIGGFIIMSTGITGVYIGKIFDQVRARPLYVIDRIAQHSRQE